MSPRLLVTCCLASIALPALAAAAPRADRAAATARWDETDAQHDVGLSRVRSGASWGAVDRTGRVVVPVRYDFLGRFFPSGAGADPARHWAEPRHELVGRCEAGPLLPVVDHGKWGYADRETGAIVVPRRFDQADCFHGPLARVRVGSAWGYVDAAGVERVPPRWDDAATVVSEGLAAVAERDARSGRLRWGFVDGAGRVVVPPRYDHAYEFHRGLALVARREPYGWILVDARGREIVPPVRYLDAHRFSEGRAAVSDGNRWGYLDETGGEVIPRRFAAASAFAGGRAQVSLETRPGSFRVFHVDRAGRRAESEGAPAPPEPPSYAVAVASRDGRWGYVDTTGAEVVPVQYDERPPDALSGRFTRVRRGGKYGYLGPSGREVVAPRYDDAPELLAPQGDPPALLRVTVAGRYGYLDPATGREVIAPLYDDAPTHAVEERIRVKLAERWGEVDRSGRAVSGFVREPDPCALEKRPGRARVFGDGASLRARPDASAAELEALPPGTELELLARTEVETTAGDVADSWYRARRGAATGFVWGGALADASSRFETVSGRPLVALVRNRTGGEHRCYHPRLEVRLVDGPRVHAYAHARLSSRTVTRATLAYERLDGFSRPLGMLKLAAEWTGWRDRPGGEGVYGVWLHVEDGSLTEALELPEASLLRPLESTSTVALPHARDRCPLDRWHARCGEADVLTVSTTTRAPGGAQRASVATYRWDWEEKRFVPAE